MAAVQAEQDRVTIHLDNLAQLLQSRLDCEDCVKLANEVLDKLAALRKSVNRGRAGQGYWDKPNWWDRDADPALMLMRQARSK